MINKGVTNKVYLFISMGRNSPFKMINNLITSDTMSLPLCIIIIILPLVWIVYYALKKLTEVTLIINYLRFLFQFNNPNNAKTYQNR
jgi:hypothetical protein